MSAEKDDKIRALASVIFGNGGRAHKLSAHIMGVPFREFGRLRKIGTVLIENADHSDAEYEAALGMVRALVATHQAADETTTDMDVLAKLKPYESARLQQFAKVRGMSIAEAVALLLAAPIKALPPEKQREAADA